MHRLTSFDEIQSKLLRCKHVCLLFDGTVQSIYLLHLICLQNIRVTALALDYGVADRDKIKMLAGQFPVAFELLDASDLYESSVVVPMIRASALCNDRHPLLRSMTESTTAQIMVNYARQADADALVHGYMENSERSEFLNRAIQQCGYEGYYGCPGEREKLSVVQQSANLLRLGCHIRDEMYQCWASSFWCQSYLLKETAKGSGDFQLSGADFYWGKVSAHLPAYTSIEFLSGLPVSMDGKPLGLSNLISRLALMAGSSGLGRFSGEEYSTDGRRCLELHIVPAAYVLARALKDLEGECLDPLDLREKDRLEAMWNSNMRCGKYFSQVKLAAEQGIMELCSGINGTVEVDLSAGAYVLRHIEQKTSIVAQQGRSA